MSFKNCEVEGCHNKALLVGFYCVVCKIRFCYDHREDPKGHSCLTRPFPKGIPYIEEADHEPEASHIIASLDAKLIAAEVESLRPGRTCTAVHIPSGWKEMAAASGSFNYHIRIDFDDGSSWVMRIRRAQSREHPPELLAQNVDSEVATLQAMARAGVKVPRAWRRPANSLLPSHLHYFYEEFVHDHHSAEDLLMPNEDLTDETRSLLHNLAEWFISSEGVQFEQGVGCLTFDKEGEITVGPLITREPQSATPPYFPGPFISAKQRYLAQIDVRLQQTMDRERYPPSLELLMYLALLEARELVAACTEMDEGPYYIKHSDERGDQIRLAEDGSIIGLIDWEWAYLTCKGEAFAACDQLLDDDFYDGKNDHLGEREQALFDAYSALGRPDLACVLEKGRKYQRLANLLDCECPQVASLNALRRAFLGEPDDAIGYPEGLAQWMDVKRKQYSHDEGLEAVVQRHLARPINIADPRWDWMACLQ